jgi:hypothetical protein
MKRLVMVAVLVCGALMLVSCAPGPNPATGGPDAAGFWQGWWNGFTMLFTFIISLFNSDVSIYEINNNGGWYNFGFVLGCMMFWGGGGGSACAGSRRR